MNPLPARELALRLAMLTDMARGEARRLWGHDARVELEEERQGLEGIRPVRIARRAVVRVGPHIVARTRWTFPYRGKGSTAERVLRVLGWGLKEQREVTRVNDDDPVCMFIG